MTRIAVYGGSFNPPHVVHAMVASWVLWTGLAEHVWLVPVWRHAFEDKQDKRLAPYEDRLRWCRAMAGDLGDARIEVSEIERELGEGAARPSFTVDTLRRLHERFPEATLRLVVGSDVLPQVPAWRDWAAIEREFSPIVVGRAGYPTDRSNVFFPDVSSSEIRRRVARGEALDGLVTRTVARLLAQSPPATGWIG